jgi:alcohol dehydrogenase (cytochrome c)/quinohemoprotein ethanol dehydrogenase
MSYSPETKLVYIPAQDTPFAYIDDPAWQPHALGFNLGINGAAASMPQDPGVKAQILAGVRGFLKAWDPIAQKEVWHAEQAGAWNGGVLSTGGSLVFEGNSAGQFNAYNATTGATVWSFATQAGVIAAPIAYAVGGQQYVAIVVGWGGTYPLSAGELSHKGGPAVNKSRVLAFRLGGTAQLPPAPPTPKPPTPPARFGDEATLLKGKVLFHTYCSVCHGDSAVGGGVLPDLRHATPLQDPARWNRIVIEGSLTNNGMVSWSSVLQPEGSEAIRAYVTGRANDEIAPPPVAAALPAPAAPAVTVQQEAAGAAGNKPGKKAKSVAPSAPAGDANPNPKAAPASNAAPQPEVAPPAGAPKPQAARPKPQPPKTEAKPAPPAAPAP